MGKLMYLAKRIIFLLHIRCYHLRRNQTARLLYSYLFLAVENCGLYFCEINTYMIRSHCADLNFQCAIEIIFGPMSTVYTLLGV